LRLLVRSFEWLLMAQSRRGSSDEAMSVMGWKSGFSCG
jgi:hypothetical protein